MHELEPSSFCTLSEYQRYIEKRKQAAELSLGELYLILAALKGGEQGKEAFRFPIRVKALDLGELAVSFVSIEFLNLDLRPSGIAEISMVDGISKNPSVREVSTNKFVQEMYVKDYEDYLDISPRETLVEEELPRQLELVGV